MKFRSRSVLVFALLAALLLPIPALAATVSEAPDGASPISFDTPTPTPRPNRAADPTPRPNRTAEPAATEEPVRLGPIATRLAPTRRSLVVGYQEPGVLGQLPLLLALQRGYFETAGFDEVTLVQTDDTLGDLSAGDLDFAVVASSEAYPDAASLRAVAGYQNYTALDGDYAGIVLMSREGLIEDEPATTSAFLAAYVQALQDLADEAGADDALLLLQATDLAIDPGVAADWVSAVGAYAPFDGGFGSLADGGGLGELAAFLSGEPESELDLSGFVSQDPINLAQAWLDLPANPESAFMGAPSLADISVGMPAGDGAPSPVVVAQSTGYFDAVGFDSVEILDVEQPLPGVLSGQLDFAILDAADAADGVAQGLPLSVIAGHANYVAGPDRYGGDVLVVSNDLLENEPSTVAAFLIAYLQGLGDLTGSVNAAAFAPYDGGLGSREIGGGLGELRDYLTQELGVAPDLEVLTATSPLHFAQTWWGIPANPAATAATTEES